MLHVFSIVNLWPKQVGDELSSVQGQALLEERILHGAVPSPRHFQNGVVMSRFAGYTEGLMTIWSAQLWKKLPAVR